MSESSRHCRSCTACCRILPVIEIGKPAQQRCPEQCSHGCRVYPSRPMSCRLWSCAWLVDPDARDLSRPDRAGYVVDSLLDFVTVEPHDGRPPYKVPVAQVWLSAAEPDAWRDGALESYLRKKGLTALVRKNDVDGFIVAFDEHGKLRPIESNLKRGPTHSRAEVAEALAEIKGTQA